jgi:hypothetical protein
MLNQSIQMLIDGNRRYKQFREKINDHLGRVQDAFNNCRLNFMTSSKTDDGNMLISFHEIQFFLECKVVYPTKCNFLLYRKTKGINDEKFTFIKIGEWEMDILGNIKDDVEGAGIGYLLIPKIQSAITTSE